MGPLFEMRRHTAGRPPPPPPTPLRRLRRCPRAATMPRYLADTDAMEFPTPASAGEIRTNSENDTGAFLRLLRHLGCNQLQQDVRTLGRTYSGKPGSFACAQNPCGEHLSGRFGQAVARNAVNSCVDRIPGPAPNLIFKSNNTQHSGKTSWPFPLTREVRSRANSPWMPHCRVPATRGPPRISVSACPWLRRR